jgi:hypothetical protein
MLWSGAKGPRWVLQGPESDKGGVQRQVQRQDHKRKWAWAIFQPDGSVKIYEPNPNSHIELGVLVETISVSDFIISG